MSQLGSDYTVGEILEGSSQDTLEINAALDAYKKAIRNREGHSIAMRKARKKLAPHPKDKAHESGVRKKPGPRPKPKPSESEQPPHHGRKRRACALDSDPRFDREWAIANSNDKPDDEPHQSEPGLSDGVVDLVDTLIGAFSEEGTEGHPNKRPKTNPRLPKHNLRSSRMIDKFAGVSVPRSPQTNQNLPTPTEPIALPAQTTFTAPSTQETPTTPPNPSPPQTNPIAPPVQTTLSAPAEQTATPPKPPQPPVNPFSSATNQGGRVGNLSRHILVFQGDGTSAPAQTSFEKPSSTINALPVPLRTPSSASRAGGIPRQTTPGIPNQTILGTSVPTSLPTQAGPALESGDPSSHGGLNAQPGLIRDFSDVFSPDEFNNIEDAETRFRAAANKGPALNANAPANTPCEKSASPTYRLPLRTPSWQSGARGTVNQTIPSITIQTATGITIQTTSSTPLQVAATPSATVASNPATQMRVQARGVIARLHQEVGVAYGRLQQELECSYGKAHKDLEKISASLSD
ncbi:MAG: hypothetical protein L6R42_000034 [Xanthoria sp. 1 TBL-2021]|nr:MAG: hypothetical protein L6R42_000034 [Xanthoria sp. 1 TBL-2021]